MNKGLCLQLETGRFLFLPKEKILQIKHFITEKHNGPSIWVTQITYLFNDQIDIITRDDSDKKILEMVLDAMGENFTQLNLIPPPFKRKAPWE